MICLNPFLDSLCNFGFKNGGLHPGGDIECFPGPQDVVLLFTGKSLSEAFILTSTNPQYDKRLFIDLPVQYMKTTSSEHVVYINCSECQNKKQFVCTSCSPHVLSLLLSCIELVNQWTICCHIVG